MNVERLSDYCLSLPGAWADWPWGGGPEDRNWPDNRSGEQVSAWDHDHPVIKVGEGERGKIFAFLGAESVGVKAGRGRDEADEWLDRYPDDASVMAYIGRSGWNSLALSGAIPEEEILEAVEESYRLVVDGLPKKHRPAGWETVGSTTEET